MTTTTDKEIDALQEEIAKHTQRKPVSRNAEWLKRRLADLKAAKKNGESTKPERKENSTIMSVSLPISAKQAVQDIVDAEKLHGASKLVRLALREWCERNGYRNKASLFAGED